MPTDVAHKRWWQSFEMLFGIPFLLAITLQMIVPLSFPGGSFTLLFIMGGVVLMVVGVTLVILARREFAQQSQPTDPGYATSRLVTSGPFSVSRNPLYLGGICFLAGIALALNLPWVVLFLLPSIVACHYILIVPEERYLATQFGKKYDIYRASVRRWLGRRRAKSNHHTSAV